MNDREGDGCYGRVCVPLIERILKRCVLSMTGKKNCREENGTKKETDRKVDNDRFSDKHGNGGTSLASDCH